MSRRLIIAVALVVVVAVQGGMVAWAAVRSSAPVAGSVSASDGGNTIHAGARGTSGVASRPGRSATHGRRRSPTRGGRRAPSAAVPVAPAPSCTQISLPTKYAAPLGPNGIAGGVFGLASCPSGSLVLANGIVVLVPRPSPTVSGSAAPATATIVQQAEDSLALPAPVVAMNPAGFSIVNLATWLWIDPVSWHPFRVTAQAGAVSVTVVAVPTGVTWTMGDGGSVWCPGPGTPYPPAVPAAPTVPPTVTPTVTPTTSCSYTYRTSSFGRGGVDPDGGTYSVAATVTWAVTWSATGVAGGGSLPALETSTHTAVRVEQVESVDTAA